MFQALVQSTQKARGVSLITTTIEAFNQQKANLLTGIGLLRETIMANDDAVDKKHKEFVAFREAKETENWALDAHIEQAETIVENIEKFFAGPAIDVSDDEAA